LLRRQAAVADAMFLRRAQLGEVARVSRDTKDGIETESFCSAFLEAYGTFALTLEYVLVAGWSDQDKGSSKARRATILGDIGERNQ